MWSQSNLAGIVVKKRTCGHKSNARNAGTQRKGHLGTQREESHLQAKERDQKPQEKSNLATP